MFDLKSAREEFARIHAEATAHTEKYSATDAVAATEDEAKAQDERFAKLESLKSNIEQADRLARLAFSRDVSGERTEPVKAKAVTVSAPNVEVKVSASREDYAAALSAWARGDEREDYATISVSGNAALVPSVVTSPITPIKYNCYAAAAAKLGIASITRGNTATATTPVITMTGGGLVTEGQQNTADSDAGPSAPGIVTTAHAYHSGAAWTSNEFIGAQSWDVTAELVPALQGSREYQFSKAVTNAIIADSGITQSVTTATHNTLIIDNLDALIHSFTLAYDNLKAIFLGMDVYNAAETLKDSNGRPIFEMFTIQDQNFVAYKGVPVFKHDTFQALTTAGNVVGCAVSFVGFRIRSETEKLVKFLDNPNYVDMTGLDNVKYQGWGYVPAAVTKLVAGT